jgi:hypothetical protein
MTMTDNLLTGPAAASFDDPPGVLCSCQRRNPAFA